MNRQQGTPRRRGVPRSSLLALGALLPALDAGAAVDLVVVHDVVASAVLAEGGGDRVDYLVEVRNDGSTGAQQVKVLMRLPEEFAGTAWTCQAEGGAACGSAQGAGDILFHTDLPAGARIGVALSTRVEDARQQGVETAVEATAAWPETLEAGAVAFYSRCSASQTISVDGEGADGQPLPPHPCGFLDSFEARH